MILVTGGCFQGKKKYVCEKFGFKVEDLTDGGACPMEALYSAKVLYHFHEYIRRLMEAGREFSLPQLIEKNPDILLITNEQGYGVVPTDRFDREYREKTGRICCQIAKEAKEVHRIVCGVGTVIKGG